MGKTESIKREIDLLPYPMLGEVERLIKKLKQQSKAVGNQTHLLSKLAAYSIEDDLPSDLADQHDHYLYGVPKK